MNTDYGHIKRSGQAGKIDKLMARFVAGLGAKNRKALRAAKIQSVWEHAAPSEVLEHTDNVFLFSKEGRRICVVYVDSPMWAAELMARKEYFRTLMERALNEGPIDEMSFKSSSAAYRKKRFSKYEQDEEREEHNPSIPLTAKETKDISDATSFIADPALRTKIRRAWEASKSASKGDDISL